MARDSYGRFVSADDPEAVLEDSFMSLYVYKGDGWIIDTNDGSIVAYDWNAPDVDSYRKYIGTDTKVQVGERYGRIEAITYVKGYFGRYSADGYLDCTEWEFDTNRKRLERTLRDMMR